MRNNVYKPLVNFFLSGVSQNSATVGNKQEIDTFSNAYEVARVRGVADMKILSFRVILDHFTNDILTLTYKNAPFGRESDFTLD
ncbi:hypothetical protein F-VV63_0225 [Faustovirus]|nr:hypothetical protein F-VV63_0225 [Faustovirus]